MKFDTNHKEPEGDNRTHAPGAAWNSSVTRRRFLRAGGAACVGGPLFIASCTTTPPPNPPPQTSGSAKPQYRVTRWTKTPSSPYSATGMTDEGIYNTIGGTPVQEGPTKFGEYTGPGQLVRIDSQIIYGSVSDGGYYVSADKVLMETYVYE